MLYLVLKSLLSLYFIYRVEVPLIVFIFSIKCSSKEFIDEKTNINAIVDNITLKIGKIRELFNNFGEFFRKNILRKNLYINVFVRSGF